MVADERVARCAEPPELVVAARTPHARALYTADAYEGRCALAFEVGGQWFLSASFLCRAVSYPSHVVGVRPHVHQQLDELSLTESSSGAVLRYAVRGDDTEITYGEIACTWASAEPRCERSGGAALY